jgi:hypothetical protein
MSIVGDITTDTGVVIVKCIVRWIYDQVAELLKALKEKLLQAISFIDRQIDALRMILSQADILAQAEEFLWNGFQAIIQQIKDAILSGIPGPEESLCPEFWEFIMAPLNLILYNYTDIFSIYRERWKSLLSFMDEVDYFISYWESTKSYLLAMIDVLDDAIYAALESAATAAEQEMRTNGRPGEI